MGINFYLPVYFEFVDHCHSTLDSKSRKYHRRMRWMDIMHHISERTPLLCVSYTPYSQILQSVNVGDKATLVFAYPKLTSQHAQITENSEPRRRPFRQRRGPKKRACCPCTNVGLVNRGNSVCHPWRARYHEVRSEHTLVRS